MKKKASEQTKIFKSLGDPAVAEHSQRFFKTGRGEYGEGDRFLGIRVPVLRKQAGQCREMELPEVLTLLRSPYHEIRLFALFVLVDQFKRGDESQKKEIYRLYLDNTRHVNNWDLVDSSAYHIVGAYLEQRDRKILYKLACSKSLWERRIAIISTLHFIRNHQFDDTLSIAEMLLTDQEDLIHKAVGWMLREVGNRDIEAEKKFLNTHARRMPRTMLRYAIEKFPETERKKYLSGKI